MTSTEAKRHADRHGAAMLRDAAWKLTMKFVDDDGDHEIPKSDVDKVRAHLGAAADRLEGLSH